MEKLNGQSMDIERHSIEKIKELFPEVVTEGRIDLDKLRLILGDKVDESIEKYQFTWNGKSQTIKLAQKPSTGTLRPAKEESKNWDTTENLYIEGDNLEVLKQLQKTYFGKIKMIYIDPPYNTGGDFVYKDDFKDSIKNYKEQTNQISRSNADNSGRYHTDWLNMMYSRMLLAKNLLSNDGVIFISIDEHELFNLKKICDEILGETNYVGTFAVENNPKGRKNSKFISVTNDYCIAYCKNKDHTYFVDNIPKNANDMTVDENGVFVHNSGKRVLVGKNNFNKTVSNTSSAKNYSIYYNLKSNDIQIKQELSVSDCDSALISTNYERFFSYNDDNALIENTYTIEKIKELFQDNKLEFKNGQIYEKNLNDSIRVKSILKNQKYKAISNNSEIMFELDLKTTSAGTDLKKLFGNKDLIFQAPKNLSFLRLLITLLDASDFTVLDFFSGSATTAHAVMKLNAEDGGNRKFIMVQLPEKTDEKSEAYKAGYKNICEIGKERIRRAGEQIKQEMEKEGKDSSKLDIGFKVFKLDETNIKEWDSSQEVTESTLFVQQEVFKESRTNEDVLYEILLKYGVFDMPVSETLINNKVAYDAGHGDMIVALFDDITSEDVKVIADKKPRVVIFKDSGFANDNVKLNALYNLEKLGVEDVKSI